eukprot:6479429-Amphidinium_carterae.1
MPRSILLQHVCQTSLAFLAQWRLQTWEPADMLLPGVSVSAFQNLITSLVAYSQADSKSTIVRTPRTRQKQNIALPSFTSRTRFRCDIPRTMSDAVFDVTQLSIDL